MRVARSSRLVAFATELVSDGAKRHPAEQREAGRSSKRCAARAELAEGHSGTSLRRDAA